MPASRPSQGCSPRRSVAPRSTPTRWWRGGLAGRLRRCSPSEGEDAFRAAESQAISELGAVVGPLVASVGGGAVLIAANRAALRSIGTVVWLRAQPATLARRVGRGAGRPLLRRAGLGPLEVLAQIAEERQAFYQDVADLVVDVDGLSSRQVARELLELLAPV